MLEPLTGGETDVNSRGTISAAIILGTIGVLAFIVQPGLVQGFVVELGLSEAAANDLAFAEMVGVAIATYVVAALGHRVNWRLIVMLSLLLAAAGNLASASESLAGLLGYARFITGLGEGGVISMSFTVIGLTTKTERNLALYLVLLLTYGAFGLWAMPYLFETIGLSGIFVIWAVLTLLSLATVPYLPTSSSASVQVRPSAKTLGVPMVLIAMLGLLAYNSAIGIAWANLFLIGMEIRPDEQAIANALLLSQFVAIAGALAAVALEVRLGLKKPIFFGIFGGAAAIALLLGSPGYALFAVSVALFNFLWNFVMPFILTAVGDMDERGEIMTYAIAMQMTGLGFGPFIAARILDTGSGFQSVFATSIVLLVGSFLLLSIPMRVHDKAVGGELVHRSQAGKSSGA
jgi:MFS family permease